MVVDAYIIIYATTYVDMISTKIDSATVHKTNESYRNIMRDNLVMFVYT